MAATHVGKNKAFKHNFFETAKKPKTLQHFWGQKDLRQCLDLDGWPMWVENVGIFKSSVLCGHAAITLEDYLNFI